MVDIIDEDGPDDPTSPACPCSRSPRLLFAQSAKDCVANGDGEISRDCVLDAAKNINDWSAGGLHASADPGANIPPECAHDHHGRRDGDVQAPLPRGSRQGRRRTASTATRRSPST